MTVGKLRGHTPQIPKDPGPAMDSVREIGATSAVSPQALASVLGIPNGEFTPKVRDSILQLAHEIERLRRDLARTRARLADLAKTADEDMLLPVLNRRAFMRELSRFIALAARHGTASSLLYFDLNGFKTINDQFGHAAGDAALKHFAETVAGQIRETDVLARIGGDEFGIILAHVRYDQALATADRLAALVKERPLPWDGRKISLGCSFGVAELHAGLNADTAIKVADQQMYAQKRAK
jgi:diguanylate cyclase (GGDEF)-like protein